MPRCPAMSGDRECPFSQVLSVLKGNLANGTDLAAWKERVAKTDQGTRSLEVRE